MSVTVMSIITDRPSAMVPSSKRTPSVWNHVIRSTTGLVGVSSSDAVASAPPLTASALDGASLDALGEIVRTGS